MPTIPLSAGIKMIEDFENCESYAKAAETRKKNSLFRSHRLRHHRDCDTCQSRWIVSGGDCLRLEHNGQNRSNHGYIKNDDRRTCDSCHCFCLPYDT